MHALQVKVGRHPHDWEIGREGDAADAGINTEWPDRTLQQKLPVHCPDDVQRIALKKCYE